MHVDGNAFLLGRLGLFMTLVMAHVQAFGQRVIVVGPNDRGLSGVLLQWTCLEGGETQTFTLDEQGFLWPTPECLKVRTVVSAFGYVTDTLVLERPSDTMAELSCIGVLIGFDDLNNTKRGKGIKRIIQIFNL